ncbi:MAG: methyl-accepting chemotaxis protein [Actinomycetota bacterium]
MHNNKFGNLPVAVKLNIAVSVCLAFLFLIGTLALTSWLGNSLENQRLEGVRSTNQLIVGMAEAYADSLEQAAEKQGQAFALFFPDSFALDSGASVEVNGTQTPVLRSGSTVINGNYKLLDRYTAATKVVATVFAKQGEDFVRVATSLKKEDGSRAAGTLLGTGHPAYAKLKGGEPYTGKAKLFGRDYMTRYLPIKNDGGAVIGILFIGIDFTEGLKALKDKILAVKVGETGYSFVLDGGREKGLLVVHPTKAGQNLLDAKDSAGRPYIQEMLEKKSGIIRYDWVDPDRSGSGPREKYALYGEFLRWGWVVATSGYTEELRQEVSAVRNSIIGGAIVLLLAAAIILTVCTRFWISRPMGKAVAAMNRIADGDLTQAIVSETRDEVGQLMVATESMRGHLVRAINEIHRASDELAGSARELAASAGTVAQSSHQQSAAATSMAASVEEMMASIQQVAQHSEEAHRMSAYAGQTSEAGAVVIQSTVGNMGSIADSVKDASRTVAGLGSKSQEIDAIVRSIKDIADQTNLLALNAAIEAARAGEQGRGFAVVADEVRKLAERTAKSTDEIAGMIGGIQHETQSAVLTMERSVTQVSTGVSLVASAGDNIAKIKDESAQVAHAVSAISDALAEQSAASGDISRNVETIAAQAESNSEHASHTAVAANQLEKLAESLNGKVSRFRT